MDAGTEWGYLKARRTDTHPFVDIPTSLFWTDYAKDGLYYKSQFEGKTKLITLSKIRLLDVKRNGGNHFVLFVEDAVTASGASPTTQRWLFKTSSPEDLRRWCSVLAPDTVAERIGKKREDGEQPTEEAPEVAGEEDGALLGVVCAASGLRRKLCNSLVLQGVRVLNAFKSVNAGQELLRCSSVLVVLTADTMQSTLLLVREAVKRKRRVLTLEVRGEDIGQDAESQEMLSLVLRHGKMVEHKLSEALDYKSYAICLREIVRLHHGGRLSPARSWTCAPPLLPPYVEPSVHSSIRKALETRLLDKQKRHAVVVLCGPLASGKTTILLQSCHCVEVSDRFNGGIFWLDFATRVPYGMSKASYLIAELLADVDPLAKPFSTVHIGGQLLRGCFEDPERPPTLVVIDGFDATESEASEFVEIILSFVRGTKVQVVFTRADDNVKWRHEVETINVSEAVSDVEEANAVLTSKRGKTTFSLSSPASLQTLALLSMRQRISKGDLDHSEGRLLDLALAEAEVQHPETTKSYYGLSAMLGGTSWSVEDLMMLWDLSEPMAHGRITFMLDYGFLHETVEGLYALPPFLARLVANQAASYQYYHSTLTWNLLESLKHSSQPEPVCIEAALGAKIEARNENPKQPQDSVIETRRPTRYTLKHVLDHLLKEEEDASLLDEDIFFRVHWLEQCLLTRKLCGAMWTRVEMVCNMFHRVLETKPIGPSTRRIYGFVPKVLRASTKTLCSSPHRLHEELWTRLAGLKADGAGHEVESVQVEDEIYYGRSLARYSTGFMTETDDDIEAFQTLLSELDSRRLATNAIHLRFPLRAEVFSGCAPTLIPFARHVIHSQVRGIGEVLIVATAAAIKVLDPATHLEVAEYLLPPTRLLQVLDIADCDHSRLLLATNLGCYTLDFTTGVFCRGDVHDAVLEVRSCGARLAVYTTQSNKQLHVWDLRRTQMSGDDSSLSLSRAVDVGSHVVHFTLHASRNAAYVVLRDETIWRVSLLDGAMWPLEGTGRLLEGVYFAEMTVLEDADALVSFHLGGVVKIWTVGDDGEVKQSGLCSLPSTSVVEQVRFISMENNRHEAVTILLCTTLASAGASLHAVDLNRSHYLGDLMALTRSRSTIEADTAFASIRAFDIAKPSRQIVTLSSGRWCYLRAWSLEELFTDVIRGWQDAQVRLKYRSVEPTSALKLHAGDSPFKVVAQGSFAGNLFVHDHETGLELFSTHAHALAICKMVIVESPATGVPVIVTLSADRMLRMWSLVSEDPLAQIPKVLPTHLCATTTGTSLAVVFTTKEKLVKLGIVAIGDENGRTNVSKLLLCESAVCGCDVVAPSPASRGQARRRKTLTRTSATRKPMIMVVEENLSVHWFQSNGVPIKSSTPGLQGVLKTPSGMADSSVQSEGKLSCVNVVQGPAFRGLVAIYERVNTEMEGVSLRCGIYWSLTTGEFQWFPELDVEALATTGHIVALLTASHSVIIYSLLSGNPKKVHEEVVHTPIHHFLVEASPPRMLEVDRIENQLLLCLAGNGGCHSFQYSFTLPSTYAV